IVALSSEQLDQHIVARFYGYLLLFSWQHQFVYVLILPHPLCIALHLFLGLFFCFHTVFGCFVFAVVVQLVLGYFSFFFLKLALALSNDFLVIRFHTHINLLLSFHNEAHFLLGI